MLVELLRPAGPELARRWLAAFLVIPPDQREEAVLAIERRVVELYSSGAPADSGSFIEIKDAPTAAPAADPPADPAPRPRRKPAR